MTIRTAQTYAHPHLQGRTVVLCREHSTAYDRRQIGALIDARVATDPCEVCCEDAAREVLGRMAHGASVLLRTVPAAVRRQLEDRRLVVEQTDGMLDPTPRAAGYCADPATFEWDRDADGDDEPASNWSSEEQAAEEIARRALDTMADQRIPLRSLAPQIEAALAVAPDGYSFRLGSGGVEVTPPDRRETHVYMNAGPFQILAVEHPAALAYAVALLDSSFLRREGTATQPMLDALAIWAC